MNFSIIKNLILKFKIYLDFGKKSKLGPGGDGGTIFIAARRVEGDGSIQAKGGDGLWAGKAAG